MTAIILKHLLRLDISGNNGESAVVRGVIKREKVVNVLETAAECSLLQRAEHWAAEKQ